MIDRIIIPSFETYENEGESKIDKNVIDKT